MSIFSKIKQIAVQKLQSSEVKKFPYIAEIAVTYQGTKVGKFTIETSSIHSRKARTDLEQNLSIEVLKVTQKKKN